MRRVLNSGKVYSAEDKAGLRGFLGRDAEIPFGNEYLEFEKALAKYAGTKHAFFVNSGSSANLLALSVFTSYRLKSPKKLNKGDEVIVLASSFPTTVFPIIQNGCVPVFIDIDIPTFNATLTSIKAATTKRTRGVMLANTLGNPMELEAIEAFCNTRDMFFINDCCDAFGSMYRGKPVFTYGDISTLSMYAAHQIFTGSGGAVFTNDDFLASLIKSYRGWGRGSCTCNPGEDNRCGHRFNGQYGGLPYGYDHKNVYYDVGYNLVATNIQAQLGLTQMNRIDAFTEIRRSNYAYLYSAIREDHLLRDKFILMQSLPSAEPSYFGFPLLLRSPHMRRELTVYLEQHGVQTRYLFAGNLTKQPCIYDNPDVEYRIAEKLDNTDKIMEDMVWVGCWHGLTLDDMEYIYQTLRNFYDGVK